MKSKQLGRLIMMFVTALVWLGFAGAVTSVRSQDLICCDTLIGADGNWFGARRDCKAALQELSAASRTKACQQIKKIKPRPKRNAPWFKPFTDSASQEGCCPEAADACGDPSMKACEGKEKPPEKENCEKLTPWFGAPPADCKDIQKPQITINQGTVTLSLCGYPIWSVRNISGATNQPDIEQANEAKAALTERVRSQLGSRICCDRFREAVRSGNPCDPRADLDCDGKPNSEDHAEGQRYVLPSDNETYSYSGSLPDINIFSTPDGASIDPFPQGLNPDDPNFIPPADKCDCKWELKKGTLNCSPDGRQPHYYQAWWRCPSTGNERFTRKSAPATAPCTPPQRSR